MDEIALENVLRKLGRTPVRNAGQALVPPPPSTPTPSDEASREALRDSMRRDFQALLRRIAQVYEACSPQSRKVFLPAWSSLQERMDRAYQQGDLAVFQAALVEARALLTDADPHAPEQQWGKHWTYRAWSRVLDAEVWFAHCEEEVAQLAKQGIQRGSIYTEAELAELLRLPQPSPKALKDLHMVKAFFSATVVPVEENEQREEAEEPPPPPVN